MNERLESKPEHLRSESDKNRLELERISQVRTEEFTKSKISKLFSRTGLIYKDCTILERPCSKGVEVTVRLTVVVAS